MSLQKYVQQLKPIQEDKESSVIRRTLLNEADTKASKELEFLLVYAAGGDISKADGKATKYSKMDTIEFKDIPNDDPIALGKQILSAVGIKDNEGGRMTEAGKLNPEWKGKNRTPKTDIIIGERRISLKSGSSQLMSGGPEESMSTFERARDKTESFALDNTAKSIITGIEELLPSTSMLDYQQGLLNDRPDVAKKNLGIDKDDIMVGLDKLDPKRRKTLKTKMFVGGKGTMKRGGTVFRDTKRKKGELFKVEPGTFDNNKLLKAATKHNKDMTELFEKMFENKEFKYNFVYEAMTGEYKFAPDKDAKADHFLVAKFNGSAELKGPELEGYVSDILSQVNPSVKFKTTSLKDQKIKDTVTGAIKRKSNMKISGKTGFYKFWSVVGLGYNAMKEEIEEAENQFLLTEELTTESFFAKVKKAFNKFKGLLKRLASAAYNFIKSSAKNMMEFLGLEPEIKFKNEIKW